MFSIRKLGINKLSLFIQYLYIRYKVFVIEDGRPLFGEFSFKDFGAVHFVLMFNKSIIGTARIIYNPSEIELGHFALLPKYRGKSAGRELLTLLLRLHSTKLIKKVNIVVEKKMISFYQKFDFILMEDVKINGNIYHKMCRIQ